MTPEGDIKVALPSGGQNIVPVTSRVVGVPHVLLTLTVYEKFPLVPAGGEAVIVNVLLEPEAMSPRSVGLTLSQVGPEILLTVTPLTMPPLAETVTVWLSELSQNIVGLQLVGFTSMLPQQSTWIVPVTSRVVGVPHVLLTLTVNGKFPLVPAGGEAVIVNVLLEPEAMSPRSVGLTLSHVGPEILLTVTPLTMPPLAETVTVWLSELSQNIVGLQLVGFTSMLPQQSTWIVPVTSRVVGVPQVLLTLTVNGKSPLVPAGGEAVIVNVLLEPEAMSPRSVGLTLSHVGPEILLTVTPLTMPPLAETVTVSLSELPQNIVVFQLVGFTSMLPQQSTWIVPVTSRVVGVPHVLLTLTVNVKSPLVPAGGEAVIVNVLLEPEAMSPRSVGLTLSHVGPEILLTVTPLTMPPLAETVTVSLSELPQNIVGFQLVGFTSMLPQQSTWIVPVTSRVVGVPHVLLTLTVNVKSPLVPAGGEAVIVNVLLEPEAMSPRSVGLTLSHVGPEILLTVTPLTMPPLAETVTVSLSELPQNIVGFQLVGFTSMLPQPASYST